MMVARWLGGAAMMSALCAATTVACSHGEKAADGGVDAAATAGWSVQNLPATAQVMALHGVGADLYVAGNDGMVLRTGDGARSWVDTSVSPASAAATIASYPVFDAIAASAADDVWVAGASAPETGVLMHTTDRGQTWQRIDVGMAGPIDGVWSVDHDHVVAATGTGQILATSDGGASWATTFSDPQMMLWGAWGSGSSDLYVVGGVAIAGDGGAGIDASDAGLAPEGGAAALPVYIGVVLHSSDGGMSWQNVAAAATACILWRVSGTADGAIVYAVGDCGSVASTTDHGATWSRSGAASAGQNYSIADVWVSPTGTSYLLPAGRGFAGPATPQNQYVCGSVDVGDNGTLVAVRTGCEILPLKDGFISSPIAIWGTTDHDVWVVGGYTPLWHRS